MDEIRTAVVGLGDRAVGTWFGLLQSIPGYRIVAICDPIVGLHARALEHLERPGDVKVYTHYDQVLADPHIDAIALTVRCKEQGLMAAQGLEAGKHVNSEVPAAHTLKDCWRIVAAAESSGMIYQLAEQTRYWGYFEAWTRLVAEGRIGRVTFAEGQYFHYYPYRYFQDAETGAFYAPEEASEHPEAAPGWMYYMPPIHYLPHELSPLLKVIDDRPTTVVGMSTGAPSAVHPNVPTADMQVALMKTEKGAILRLAASFSQPHPHRDLHWQQVVGTEGCLEWKRSGRDYPKMWFLNGQMFDMAEVDWRYQRTDAPREARGSGHGDADYYVHVAFRDAVLGHKPLEWDVYAMMDTAAPAILAADSMAEGSVPMDVPSFRPSDTRPAGQMPEAA